MILILDSYDSFVHNLARYVREAGVRVVLQRSDALTVSEALALQPRGILLSPGPCTPSEAGIGVALVQTLAGGRPEACVPLLGVCLGHQVVAEALGGRLREARPPRHGRAALVTPTGEDLLLEGLPRPFAAGLYHSLSVDPETLPPEIRVTARDDAGEIMALRHRALPLFGVQFHPESILTPGGRRILRNFLDLVGTPAPGDSATRSLAVPGRGRAS